MRILHILDHSLPLHSGYTFRTAAILREQRALGWETFHLTSPRQGTSAAEEAFDGLNFLRSPRPAKRLSGIPVVREIAEMNALRARLAEVVEQIRPDLLHAHSPVLNALPALSVARRRDLPLVYEVRAFWEDAAVDHGTTTENSLRYRASRRLESWALTKVTAVTCICEGLRAEIEARGVPAERITVIPNAVDPEQFDFALPTDLHLKQKLGLGQPVIGFIGSFYAYEGLDLLLTAVPSMLRKQPTLRVLLVGGGPQEPALRRQASSLGITDAVMFAGRVPHAQVKHYYSVIDVLVYARHRMRLTDLVTPLKPLEAMAQGRLFVASDVGGHRELVRDGETGVLFPAGDSTALAAAVVDLLSDSRRRARLRLAARAFVTTERTWASSVDRYRAVYQAALIRGGRELDSDAGTR